MDVTRLCNLRCIHCYSNAINEENPNELSTEEAEEFIDDLQNSKFQYCFSQEENLSQEVIYFIL